MITGMARSIVPPRSEIQPYLDFLTRGRSCIWSWRPPRPTNLAENIGLWWGVPERELSPVSINYLFQIWYWFVSKTDVLKITCKQWRHLCFLSSYYRSMIFARIPPSPSVLAVLTKNGRYIYFHPLNRHPNDNSVSPFALFASSMERLLFPENPAALVYNTILAPRYLWGPKQDSGTSQASSHYRSISYFDS